MARKGVFPIVATLAVVGVVLAVFSQTVMRDSNISTNTMTTEQAYADLSGKMKRIGVQEVSLTPPTIEIVVFLGGAAKFITKPCLKQRVMRFPTIRYGCSV